MKQRNRHKEHLRELELHPNYNKEQYQRALELHHNYNKKRYQRTIELQPDYPKWQMTFRGKRIYLGYNPLKGTCSKCKRTVSSGKIKQTQLHHDIYDWSDILAHTRELCNKCHNEFHTGKPKIPVVEKP